MIYPVCAQCKAGFCIKRISEEKELPEFCPMKKEKKLIVKSLKEYRNEKMKEFYPLSVLNEKEAYEVVRGERIPVRPRVKELIEFANKLDIKKIGIAFCVGLSEEALILTKILKNNRFEVYSVICKCGGIDKVQLGVPKEYKIENPNKYEPACNPVLQAYLLNKVETEINVIVGLCIGHDIIFTKYSKAPVTTFIVKDRYTGHNPVISLYNEYHKVFISGEK